MWYCTLHVTTFGTILRLLIFFSKKVVEKKRFDNQMVFQRGVSFIRVRVYLQYIIISKISMENFPSKTVQDIGMPYSILLYNNYGTECQILVIIIHHTSVHTVPVCTIIQLLKAPNEWIAKPNEITAETDVHFVETPFLCMLL